MNVVHAPSIKLNESPLDWLEKVYQESKLKHDDINTLEFAIPRNDFKLLYGLLLTKAEHLSYTNDIFYYRNIPIIPE